MAVTKVEAGHIAQAAAHGVALALSLHGQETKQEFHLPPHIICGIPPYIFQAALKAGPEGTVTVGAITEAKQQAT
jgi:hypothetical protein